MDRLSRALRALHEDEDGMEAVQVVMIIAIGAVILMAIVKLWPQINQWMKGSAKQVIEFDSPDG